MFRVGLLSDTHGLLRPEARAFLQGSDLILHAGDVGDPAVLEDLAGIAPVVAVRGNCDQGPWALRLNETERLSVAGVSLLVIHDLAQLVRGPGGAGAQVVVHGHSHQPRIETRDGVLFVNPGSAGPRRFRLPVSAGELDIDGGAARPRTVDLLPGAAAGTR